MVNIGLAAWCVHNLRFLHKDNTEAFYLFSFAKFLRCVTCAIDVLVAFFYYTLEGDPVLAIMYVLSYSFSAIYEFYYSYIAWSLVYHVARGDHGNDGNAGNPFDYGGLPEDDGHTPMVAFPASKSDPATRQGLLPNEVRHTVCPDLHSLEFSFNGAKESTPTSLPVVTDLFSEGHPFTHPSSTCTPAHPSTKGPHALLTPSTF